jgi:hypothetical protein
VLVVYQRGTTVGNPVACLVAKQVNYDPSRGGDGSLTFAVQTLANLYGLEWCELLLSKATHASATNGTSIDYGAVETLFGATVYVVVVSVATGSMTPEIQDSANNSTFAAITGMTLAANAAGDSGYQRVTATSPTQSIRRYVRIASTGTFTNAIWAAAFVRYLTAQE